METKYNSYLAPRIILGVGIILIGIVFLLGNLDIIYTQDYIKYWPALILIFGIAHLLQNQHGPGRVWGIILTFVGAAMLIDRVYFFRFSLWDYWPLILVIIGLMMIFKVSSHHRVHIATPSVSSEGDNSFLRATAIMGGFKRVSNSQDFKGGELTAIMGGFELDLRDAAIKEEAVIEVFTLMGGMSMRIPEDWLVIINVSPFMGGYDDKTRPPKENAKRLIIKGTTIMGGIEIKN